MYAQKRLVLGILFVLFFAISANGQNCACCCDSATAAPAVVLPNYSGCCHCREYFLGDMCGLRTRAAEQGVTFVGDVTQYYQGVTSGGLNDDFEYGLHSDRVYTFDMDKLAGMKGMFLKVRHETQLGDFINRDTGSLLAANSSGLFPNTDGDTTAITNFTLIQMLSPTFGFYAGKLDTMDGDLNAYAHGRGKDQFMNIGLVATPIAFRTTPYSTWGAGMMVLGEEGTPIFNLAILDPRDFATTINVDEVFEEGATISAELRLPTNFLSKPGHQLFGGVWSGRDVALLSAAPLLLLPNVPTPTSEDSWALYWNFDQQLFSNCCDPSKGWGVFGRAAIADEDTNPLEWFLSFGIGGNSPIRCRQNDTFGAGWFYGATSDQLPGLVLDDAGQGVELFYNYEVTPWLRVTPDLQFIDPARRNVNDATVFGLRVKMTL